MWKWSERHFVPRRFSNPSWFREPMIKISIWRFARNPVGNFYTRGSQKCVNEVSESFKRNFFAGLRTEGEAQNYKQKESGEETVRALILSGCLKHEFYYFNFWKYWLKMCQEFIPEEDDVDRNVCFVFKDVSNPFTNKSLYLYTFIFIFILLYQYLYFNYILYFK